MGYRRSAGHSERMLWDFEKDQGGFPKYKGVFNIASTPIGLARMVLEKGIGPDGIPGRSTLESGARYFLGSKESRDDHSAFGRLSRGLLGR